MDTALGARTASRRWTRAFRVCVWGVWGIAVTVIVTSTLVWVFNGLRPLPLSFATGGIGVAALAGCGVVFLTLGAILATKLPRNPIGWLLLAVGIALACLTPVNLVVQRAFEVARPFPQATLVVAWLMSSHLTPVATVFILLVCLVFPDGRFLPGRWWIGGAMAIGGGAALAFASAIEPTGLIWYPAVPNPAALPLEYLPLVAGIRLGALALITAGMASAAASIVVRYRRSDASVRRQLRWIVTGMAAMIAGLLPFLIARYAMDTPDAVGEVLVGIAALATCAFPISVALAIVRQHLFDIDQIISTALVYVPLMGLLAGLYTASLALFQRIFVALTHDTSDAAIVLSALILASVFAPIRSALEARVHSRFRLAPAAAERIPRDRAVGEPMPASAPARGHGEPMPLAAPARLAGPAVTPITAMPDPVRARASRRPTPAGDITARIADLEATLAELRGATESPEDA